MLLCFHWNVFKYVVVFSLDPIYYSHANVVWLYVDMIYGNRTARELNYMFGKKRGH